MFPCTLTGKDKFQLTDIKQKGTFHKTIHLRIILKIFQARYIKIPLS